MKVFNNGTKFNDVLTKNIIEKWDTNIILDGATGSGKTYFVEHNLYEYCKWNNKKILFLCNRTALYEDVLLEKEILKLKNLEIMLYQTLQNKLINREKIKYYDYIVCDEFHYVLTDALFNIYTDITYDWLKNQEKSIKIFMSGTGGNIFCKLIEDNLVDKKHIYRIPYDYSYANIKFYKKISNVYDIIDDVLQTTNEDKIIYFANSIQRAKNVYKQFKEYSVFRCSNTIKDDEADKLNNIECIKTYNKDLITFDNRVLITTKALDNGITLKDKNIKHIISDIFDLDSAQQCLGRKRLIDSNDKCTFYVMNYDKKALGNFKGGLHKILNPIELLVEDEQEFNKKYENDRKFHSDYIYYENGIRKYNKLAYWKMKNENEIIEKAEEKGYMLQFLINLCAKIDYCKLEYLEEYEMKDEFQLYLQDITGKKLFKGEQEELINKISLKDKRGRLQTSLKSINIYLQENYEYTLVSTKESKGNNRGKRYWIITKGIN